jgi:VWFA-related protein
MFALELLLSLILLQEVPTFRSDVSLVRLDAEVTDGIRTLHGFRKEDFVVKDNGQPRQVLYFSQDEVPLDVILLFDISGSMRPNVERVAASANSALAELRSGDRVAIMTFHRVSRIVAPFTENLNDVERAINERVVGGRFGGGTRLLAGVDDAAKYFLEQPRNERRRAVVILTDDYGQRSRKSSTVIHHLWEADASLSGLIIRHAGEQALNTVTMAMNPLLLALREGMEGVADKTGGDTLKGRNAGEDFREMMRRIRQRYSLYYAMPQGKTGEQRMVRVELSGEALSRYPNARVRAPKGYVMR